MRFPFWLVLGGCLSATTTLGAAPATPATSAAPAGQPSFVWQERPEWSRFFSEAGAQGTLVVVDERQNLHLRFNAERSEQRFIPASTFKIPHALFALEAGVVQDEFQVFRWDGVAREFPSWNRDQDLRSSFRSSTVWVYQHFARELGLERERQFLEQIHYGNADPSGGLELFWLTGALRISAVEQITFLQKLYRNQLPFRREHQRLVKDMILVEAGRDWILRGKTGWDGNQGWFVGWVERPNGAIFFALHMDLPGRLQDAPKREAITRAVLQTLGALPSEK